MRNELQGRGEWVRKALSSGRVAERLKAPDSKSGVRETVPWVQIPPLPPCLFSGVRFELSPGMLVLQEVGLSLCIQPRPASGGNVSWRIVSNLERRNLVVI